MGVCERHQKKPAFIYAECIGCEIERLRQDLNAWKQFAEQQVAPNKPAIIRSSTTGETSIVITGTK